MRMNEDSKQLVLASTKKRFRDRCKTDWAIVHHLERIKKNLTRIHAEKAKLKDLNKAVRDAERAVLKQRNRILSVTYTMISLAGSSRENIGRRKAWLWEVEIGKQRRVLRQEFNAMARRRGLAL